MGTSGLVAAVGRLLRRTDGASAATTAGQAAPAPVGGHRRRRPLLVVVGTADPSAPAQIAQLAERGARHVSVSPDILDSGVLSPPGAPDSDGVTVLSIDSGPGIRPGSARRLVSALARLAADRAGDADLVLTGGETARRVLDALGVAHLAPLGQIHHGAVHALTPDGRHVVTRPGSFGDTDSLLRIDFLWFARGRRDWRDAPMDDRAAFEWWGGHLRLPCLPAALRAPRPGRLRHARRGRTASSRRRRP